MRLTGRRGVYRPRTRSTRAGGVLSRRSKPMSDDSRSSTASPPRGSPRVISIGGGPGGAGKSLLAVNLGVYLAQLGRNVVVADVDPAGAGLHTLLGIDPK